MLLKRDYVQKDPQEYLVDNEVNVKRTVLAVFNLRRKDFATQDEYDLYLDKIEEMVCKLMDPEATDEEKTSVRQFIDTEKIKHS